MNVQPELDSVTNQGTIIQNGLMAELEKLKLQKFPQGFPKPIHVLQPVDNSVDSEWEQRLQQAGQDHIGEHVALIPYYLGNFHWIGIFIEYKESGQIRHAEFINSLIDFPFIPDKIQMVFDKFYPDVVLFSKKVQKHRDPKQSAQMTIQNLLRSVEESLFTTLPDQNINDLNSQRFDDQQNETCLHNSNPLNWRKPTATIRTVLERQGNKMRLNNLENPSTNVRTNSINKNRRQLLKRQSCTEQQIEKDENFGTHAQPDIKKSYSDNLSIVLTDSKEPHNISDNNSILLTNSFCQPEQYESLKKQLQGELDKYEINDEKELAQEILKKKEEVQTLEKQKRINTARKRQESLSKLEELQALVDKLKAFEYQQKISNLEALKENLSSGLSERDVKDEKELKEEIIKKKQQIETLEKQGKCKTVIKRQESLSALEQLLGLIDKIKGLELAYSIDNPDDPKALLINGLIEHNISDEKELNEEIIKRKQEIEILKNTGKYEIAEQQQNSLSALEELQVLANKIRALESPHSSKNDGMTDNIGVTDRPNDDETIHGQREKDTITKESIKNIYDDFILMPPCTEKSLLNLLFLVALKLVDEVVVSENTIIIPDEIETEIVKEVQYLKEQLKIEELECTQIENLIGIVSINIKDRNWKSAFKTLEKILSLIKSLNIPELFRLFEKVDEAAHIIKGEDIILLLGGTGAGKSTTIHFLGGSQLKEIKVTGLNHIHPVEIKNPDLKKITTTPFARSETRYITPVRLYFKDVGMYPNESIVLCDSPGFEDTNGPEVDIANGIGIVKAIKESKSVRPVILISYKSIGDRCKGVKNLAHVLVGLIPEIQDHLKTISYIFTKFPPEERSTIHALLHDVNNRLTDDEKLDVGFTSLLKDMIQKTKNGAQIIDPINDDPGEILKDLASSATIVYPDEVFQFSITEKSKIMVQEQARRDQLAIISATKRSDYLFVKYKLDQLKQLNHIIDQEYVKQIYNECIRHISKHLSQEYEQEISFMNHCFMSQTIMSNESIQHYQASIDHAKLADKLRENHLGEEVIHSSAFVQYVNEQIDILFTELREKEINDIFVKQSLDKIKLVTNSFSEIDQKKYQSICQNLTVKFELVINSFKNSVLSNNFDESAEDIKKLHESLTTLQNHLDFDDMKRKYIEVQEYFLNYLNNIVEKLNYLFDQEKLNKNDINQLDECIVILENARNTFTLQPYVSKKNIDDIYENFLSKILNYFQEIVQKVNTELEKENALYTLGVIQKSHGYTFAHK